MAMAAIGSGTVNRLREPAAFARHPAALRDLEWVVYAKHPFAGPQQVLDYLEGQARLSQGLI